MESQKKKKKINEKGRVRFANKSSTKVRNGLIYIEKVPTSTIQIHSVRNLEEKKAV